MNPAADPTDDIRRFFGDRITPQQAQQVAGRLQHPDPPGVARCATETDFLVAQYLFKHPQY